MSLLELHTDKQRDIDLQVVRITVPNMELMLYIAPWLAEALEHDLEGMSVYECLARIDRGEYGLICVEAYGEIQAAIVVTARVIAGRRRALHVVACGGSLLDVWLSRVLVELEQWARESDCTAITLVGRKGWSRVLRTEGYGEHARVQVKRL